MWKSFFQGFLKHQVNERRSLKNRFTYPKILTTTDYISKYPFSIYIQWKYTNFTMPVNILIKFVNKISISHEHTCTYKLLFQYYSLVKFRVNVCNYNSASSFVSFGAKINLSPGIGTLFQNAKANLSLYCQSSYWNNKGNIALTSKLNFNKWNNQIFKHQL